jgi:hypothetical protein
MSAISPATGRSERAMRPLGPVRWWRLVSVALRVHKGSLAGYVGFSVLVAVAMAVTGLVLQASGQDVFSAAPHSPWRLYDLSSTSLRLVLPLMPVLAGLFLGASLVAREIETGTARFAWAQGAGRASWLLASVIPVGLILVVIAAGLGLEYRWWMSSLAPRGLFWSGGLFTLNPLPFAGWMLAGFSAGVVLGAAIRRTVPAMAATLACTLVGMYSRSRGSATTCRPCVRPPRNPRSPRAAGTATACHSAQDAAPGPTYWAARWAG